MAASKPRVATNVAEVQMMFSYGGQQCQNTFFVFDSAGAWTQASLQALAVVFHDFFETNVVEYPTSMILQQIICTDLTSLNSPRIVYVTDLPLAGSGTEPGLPNNVTVALKASIGKRGRGRAGRVFYLGLNRLNITGNNLNAADATTIEGRFNALITNLTTANPAWVMSVPHFTVDKVWQNPAPHDPVLNYTVTDGVLDSQRDRLPNHKKASKKKVPTPTP